MIPIDPTSVLLGASMVLLTVSSTLALLVHRHAPSVYALFVALAVSLACLLGIMGLDLGGAGVVTTATAEQAWMSLVVATHRRLLLILPVLLTATSLIILASHRSRIVEKSAREYRNAIAFGSGLSLIAIIVVAIESMM